MIREQMMSRAASRKDGFRWRGEHVSRLEALSDVVFGFALTLLVVSLEVPRTFDHLLGAMAGFVPFGFSFSVFAWLWYRHYLFFRRYGLEDAVTIVLNAILLFVVLFYVYPLKFASSTFVLWVKMLGHGPAAGQALAAAIRGEQVAQMFIIYGLGFAALFVIFGLLYLHAYRLRAALELNVLEVVDTQESMLSNFGVAAIGLLSVLVAAISDPWPVPWAAMVYGLIGVWESVTGVTMGRRRQKLAAGLAAAERESG
jgi:hypothetical protein